MSNERGEDWGSYRAYVLVALVRWRSLNPRVEMTLPMGARCHNDIMMFVGAKKIIMQNGK
jgi:hypothetical protein